MNNCSKDCPCYLFQINMNPCYNFFMTKIKEPSEAFQKIIRSVFLFIAKIFFSYIKYLVLIGIILVSSILVSPVLSFEFLYFIITPILKTYAFFYPNSGIEINYNEIEINGDVSGFISMILLINFVFMILVSLIKILVKKIFKLSKKTSLPFRQKLLNSFIITTSIFIILVVIAEFNSSDIVSGNFYEMFVALYVVFQILYFIYFSLQSILLTIDENFYKTPESN